jgi:hypothetical protein
MTSLEDELGNVLARYGAWSDAVPMIRDCP